jgi:hypothetical protein
MAHQEWGLQAISGKILTSMTGAAQAGSGRRRVVAEMAYFFIVRAMYVRNSMHHQNDGQGYLTVEFAVINGRYCMT